VAEIIDFSNRKKLKDDLGRTDKLEALQSLITCGRCGRRCAKCGAYSESLSLVERVEEGLNFRLCPLCLEEYRDLLFYLRDGRGQDDPLWHNREWVRLWLAWLEYQLALANFLTSPELLEIIEQLTEKPV